MKKIALLFIAFAGLTFTSVAQEEIVVETIETEINGDVITAQDTKTGEMMIAVTKGGNFAEGELVEYRLYGPGKAHWGSARFVLVEIFPILDPTTIGENMQVARTGFKKGKVTFGGGSTK